MLRIIVGSVIGTLLLCSPAFAYIGPGMAASTIAVVFGIIGSIFLALFAVIWYPLKRLFKRKKSAVDEQDMNQPTADR